MTALLAVTVAVRRRHGTGGGGRGFFVAGGSLSALTTACSMAATSVGGSSTVLTAALVYHHGLAGLWMDLSGALGYLLLGLWVAGPVRRSGVISIAELAGARYGQRVRKVVALLVVLAEIGWLALLSRAAAAVMAPQLPALPHGVLVAGTVAVVLGYTLLGGQFAVSYTDMIQVAVMLLGLCLLAPLILLNTLGPKGRAGLLWGFPTSSAFGWPKIGSFLLLTGLPHLVGSDIYAKVLSAKDERAARRGAVGGALLKTVFAAAIGLVSLAGARVVGQLAKPELLLGTVVGKALPLGASQLVTLALVATMMSSADQVLLSAVTMVAHDLWPAPNAVPLFTVALAGAALVPALVVPSLVDLMRLAYTVFAAGLALPILTTIVPGPPWPRWSIAGAMLAGGITGATLHIARLAGAEIPADPVVIGTAACALVLLAGHLRKKST